jgi:hypothetical protein
MGTILRNVAPRERGHEVRTDLSIRQCSECSIIYAIPEWLHSRARKNPEVSWYCPNGHSQHYPGDTPERRAQRAIERAESAEAMVTHYSDQLEAERRSKAAVKGHLTRARRRGGAGLCPVEGCRRHFPNLSRHLDDQHPGYVESLNT